jgi:hypothetical protein
MVSSPTVLLLTWPLPWTSLHSHPAGLMPPPATNIATCLGFSLLMPHHIPAPSAPLSCLSHTCGHSWARTKESGPRSLMNVGGISL